MAWSLLIGLCLHQPVFSQDSTSIVKFEVSDESKFLRGYDGLVKDQFESQKIKEEVLRLSYNRGYLRASFVDSERADTLIATLELGDEYKWASFTTSEHTEEYLRKAGYNISRVEGRALSVRQVNEMMEGVLVELENAGFPFAALNFDSVEVDSSGIKAFLNLEKGPLVLIDSVVLNGNLKVRESYLTNLLGISEGSVYSEKKVMAIQSRLKDLSFVEEVTPPTVQFEKGETKINLYLNKKPSSKFDGIIGVLPDDNTGRILIVGDATLHLENAIKQGEVFHLEWRKLQSNTQELKASAIAPYLLNSPVTLDGELSLYRRDTTFVDIFRELGVRYVFGADDFLRLFVDRQTSNLISTSAYAKNASVPEFLDRAITLYGLGGQIESLDQKLNPSKGFFIQMESGVGQRSIIKNVNLPEVIYDSLNAKSLFLNSNAQIDYYVPVFGRFVWHQRYMGSSILNDEILTNEAQRLGGLKSIRGFDEQSIFATSNVIIRNEMRYRLENESYAFLFFDGAWYENKTVQRIGPWRDLPFGTGAGMSFKTKAGVFSLVYALGSQQNNPLQLRSSKIHFGFLSVF